jgi:Phosphatidylinositol 3- and 4-kinase
MERTFCSMRQQVRWYTSTMLACLKWYALRYLFTTSLLTHSWQGKHLRIPELVPFRLTQNMISAFGPSGCNGAFSKACETTLGVLRDNRTSVMGILEILRHDSPREWGKDEVTSAVVIFHKLITRVRSTFFGGYIGEGAGQGKRHSVSDRKETPRDRRGWVVAVSKGSGTKPHP